MRAIVLENPGTLARADRPEPSSPADGEALVRVRRIGVCGTDYHAFGGNQNFFTYPRILGHELAVTVEAVGPSVSNVRPGDDCAVMPYISCGVCVACRRGSENCCENMDVLGVMVDGGMQDRFVIDASLLFSKPSLDLDTLAMVEPFGVGYHAVERSRIAEGEFALVVGAGPIGLAIAQAVTAKGATAVLADNDSARLDLAVSLQGATILDPSQPRESQLREIGSGDLPTTVFDATGNVGSMESSVDFVSASGTVVFVGHTTSMLSFDNPTIHRKELSIVTSRLAVASEWLELLDLIDTGTLSPGGWIGARCELDEVVDVFEDWIRDRGSVVKAMITVAS